ncbi:MAG: hypothetical protein GY813_18300 [Halieaceae bacterium]|nr:hypothetical protein [Halieaceae bacterium]
MALGFHVKIIMLAVAVLASLAACSDSNDGNAVSVEPDEIISIDDSNAEVCDLLDTAKCLLPFPSNFFTRKSDTTDNGLLVNFSNEAMLTNASGIVVDSVELNRNDGFSPGTVMITQVPNLDMAATGAPRLIDLSDSRLDDSPIVVINAATGERQLIWSELDSNAQNEAEFSLLIRVAKNLQEGQRYIVALRSMKNSAGETISPTELFRAYRDNISTDSDAAEARRPAMEAIFSDLQSANIARHDLYLAWDFTVSSTRNLSERILHMRDTSFAALAGGTPEFTIDSVEDLSMTDENWGRRIEGTITVPNFMDSDDASAGSSLFYADDGDALPDRMNGDNTTVQPFICNISNQSLNLASQSAESGGATRVYLYGHGLLGSRYQSTNGAHQGALSNRYNLMNCAMDFIGMAESDVENAIAILQGVKNFSSLPDRSQQGFLNWMYLAELLRHADGFATHEAFQVDGRSVYDRSHVYYYGNSEGGILGGALLATAPNIDNGVLGVPGMNYSLLLRRSVDFDLYSAFLKPAFPDVLDRTLLLSLFQMLWDRGENNGYANHLVSDPLPNTPAKNVLLHVAFGDHQVTHTSAEIMARTMGIPLHKPALVQGRHHDIKPFVELPSISTYPHIGSALVYFDGGPGPNDEWDDTGTHVPPVINQPPRTGNDPHERPRRDPRAMEQISGFMSPESIVINACGAGPCLVDGWNGVLE